MPEIPKKEKKMIDRRAPSWYGNLKPIQKGEHRGRKPGVPNKMPLIVKVAALKGSVGVGV